MPIPSSAFASGIPSLASVPPAPREPSATARRLVFGYQGSQLVMAIVGGVFLFVGVLFVGIFAWSVPVDLTLLATGKPYSATVASAEVNTHAEINDEHPVDVRYTYSFDGAQFEGSTSMVGDAYRELQPGSTIEIEVAGARPQWSRGDGHRHLRGPRLLHQDEQQAPVQARLGVQAGRQPRLHWLHHLDARGRPAHLRHRPTDRRPLRSRESGHQHPICPLSPRLSHGRRR
ncbi:MAG: DUF3592 domain-containing protein [Myxococcales bacterium]